MAKKEFHLPDNYDRNRAYSIADAAALLPQLSTSKFVGSVDADVLIKISKKQQNESLRGSIVFAHSFGETKKIIVFADEKRADEAKKAGAVAAGLEDLVKKVEKNEIEFDVVIATPDVMPQIARLGKVLGPRGLMPNPANGTIGTDVSALVASYMSGRQNFKMNDQGAIRTRVAKLDMPVEQIADNIRVFLRTIQQEGRKFGAQPFEKITLSPTMGSPIRLDLNSVYAEIA